MTRSVTLSNLTPSASERMSFPMIVLPLRMTSTSLPRRDEGHISEGRDRDHQDEEDEEYEGRVRAYPFESHPKAPRVCDRNKPGNRSGRDRADVEMASPPLTHSLEEICRVLASLPSSGACN